jgi:hypothetical protein
MPHDTAHASLDHAVSALRARFMSRTIECINAFGLHVQSLWLAQHSPAPAERRCDPCDDLATVQADCSQLHDDIARVLKEIRDVDNQESADGKNADNYPHFLNPDSRRQFSTALAQGIEMETLLQRCEAELIRAETNNTGGAAVFSVDKCAEELTQRAFECIKNHV